MRDQLTTSQSRKKLADYHTIVSKKKRLKEENQRRKSTSVMPTVSSGRKPLRPTNHNTTVTRPSNLNSTVTMSKPGLNTTVTIKKARKPSLELATCPPWSLDTRPRYHEDPVTAVTSLNTLLGISV